MQEDLDRFGLELHQHHSQTSLKWRIKNIVQQEILVTSRF